MTATSSQPSSLALLVTALDHLDTTPDPQRLAERVQQVCEDQGLVVTPDQARVAAQQALTAPLVDQEAAIQAHLVKRPADRATWEQEQQASVQRLKRAKRWWLLVSLVMGTLPSAVLIGLKLSGTFHDDWDGVVLMGCFMGVLLGGMAGVLGLAPVDELKNVVHPLQLGNPTWGTDDQGRHWSQSPQALRVYQRLMATDVPLLVQDLYLLNRVAQTEWQAQRDQSIQARLHAVTA